MISDLLLPFRFFQELIFLCACTGRAIQLYNSQAIVATSSLPNNPTPRHQSSLWLRHQTLHQIKECYKQYWQVLYVCRKIARKISWSRIFYLSIYLVKLAPESNLLGVIYLARKSKLQLLRQFLLDPYFISPRKAQFCLLIPGNSLTVCLPWFLGHFIPNSSDKNCSVKFRTSKWVQKHSLCKLFRNI